MNEDLNIPINKLALKGRATIQVFDEETGELIEEQQHDNYISPHYLRVASMFLPRNLMVNSQNNLFPLGGNSPITGYMLAGIINKLLLTSSSDPVNEEYDTHIKGDTIGYGQINLSGAYELQSGFNSSESVLRGNYKKFVYDFSTSQGNGTFQSIYTGNFDVNSTGITTYSPTPITGFNFARDSIYGNTDFYNGYIYYLSKSSENTALMSLYRVKVSNFSDYGAFIFQNGDPFETESTDKMEFPLNLSIQANCSVRIVNGLCFILYNNIALYRVTLTETPVVSRIVNDINSSSWGIIGTIYVYTRGLLLYESSSNTLMICRAVNNGVGPFLYTRVNLDGTFHSNTSISSEMWAQMTNHSTWSKHHQGYIIGNTRLVNPITSELSNGQHSSNYKYPITHDLIGYVDGTKIKCGVACSFFSRVRLDNPVTKTPVNTMKITYEFFIEPPAMKPLNFTIPTI